MPPPSAGRKLQILRAIVEEYIETGEPVSSRSVSRRSRLTLSPASVRNVMADLYEEGFLSQPHTSAGRIPTGQAFTSYVQSLTAARLPGPEVARMQAELSQAESMEARIERSSRMLTELTRTLGIAAAIPQNGQTLEHVELIGLADRRVLMIVVTEDRIVRNRIISLDEVISAEELQSIRNYINRSFGGWKLTEIHAELRQRLAAESAAFDEILRKLNLLYEKGLLEVKASPEVHMEGASNLVGLDLHLTREKMRELFRALEEKKRVLQLLDRFLETPAGELAVRVGLAEAHPSMRELSLIGLTIQLPNGLAAKIAVIGPMRMNYEKAMGAVAQVGQVFGSLQV